jgi:hypothetical protein
MVFSTDLAAQNNFTEPKQIISSINLLNRWVEEWIKPKNASITTETNARQQSLLAKYAARDGDSLFSQRIDLLLGSLDNSAENQAALGATYLKNQLWEQGANLIRNADNKNVDNIHIETLLNSLAPDQASKTQLTAIQEMAKRHENLNIPISDYAKARLAIICYFQNDEACSTTYSASLSNDSSYVGWRDYLKASWMMRRKDFEGAIGIFQRLCTTHASSEAIRQSACLSAGKLLASLGRHEQSSQAFSQVSGNSELFSASIYENIWSLLNNKNYQQTLNTSDQWQKLFNFDNNIYEVERLRALALLESKQFQDSLESYNQLDALMKLEKRNVLLLSKTYENRSAEFLNDYVNSEIPSHITKRLRGFLDANSSLSHLKQLAIDLNATHSLLANLKNRTHRLEIFLNNSEIILDPQPLNHIDRGLVLYNVANNLRSEIDSSFHPTEKFGIYKTVLLEKNYQTKLELAAQMQRLITIEEHLRDNEKFYIGTKYQLLSNLLNQTKQTRHRFDEYQGKLAEIDSVSAALENSLWTQSILQSSQKSQQIININPANVHPSLLTAVDQLQKNIDQLAIQLKQQNSPTILDKKNILSKLKKINGQIKPLDAKLQNTETKLNQIAGQLLNTLLENYKSRLEALNNEIQWGQINSGHAYASFIKSKSDKLNRQHQKAVNNYLSRFHNEAP